MEGYFINLWSIAILFFTGWFFILSTRKFLTLWQHAGYKNLQFWAYCKTDFWKFFPKHIILLVVLSIIAFYSRNSWIAWPAYLCFMGYTATLIWIYYKINLRNKKKIVYTSKIKKYIAILIILIIIGIFYELHKILAWQLDDLLIMLLLDPASVLRPEIVVGILNESFLKINIFLTFVMLGMPILISLASLIMIPFDALEKKKFIRLATKKLNRYPGNVIGITGSYGKTSTKFIIADVLNFKQYTLATPNSFNTTFGVTMTIDKYLTNIHENFIVEMGAKYKNDIAEIAEFVTPSIGIITSIGSAHLETFKTQENILNTKFELIENLAKYGTAILNYDDKLAMSYQIKRDDINVVTVSLESDQADYFASNLTVNESGTSFDLTMKNGETIHIATKLLGRHNIYNVMFAIATAKLCGLTNDQVVQAVKYIRPIKHRLELKTMFGVKAIDNAFNSNIVGATESVNVLSMHKGHKVIFTPGFVELGAKDAEIHNQFGGIIAKSCIDDVILVGIKKTKDIKKGLEENNYDAKHIYVVNSFAEGIATLQRIAKKDTLVLFENDLPIDE